MHDHPDLSDAVCMNQNQWKNKVRSVKLNTAQRWRKDFPKSSSQLEKLKGDRTKRNEKLSPVFPTIEKEILLQRLDRVQKNRDHSFDWMIRATKRLINDENKLKK